MSKLNDLTQGSIIQKLLMIAVPILLTTISQMAYNLTDMFWIGRVDQIGLIEGEAISAIGTASYITWFAFGLILVAKIGTSVKVAHSVGEKNWDKLQKVANNGLFLELCLGIFFSIIIFFLRRPILSIFNIQSAQVIEYAMNYLAIVGGLLVFQFVSSGFSAVNEGLGKTKTNFKIMLVGLILNMILDPLFILVFRLGVSGAAIATVIAQAVTMIIFFCHYRFASHRMFQLQRNHLSLKMIGDIIRIGLPAGVQSMFFTSISIFIARMVFVYGEFVVAAQRVGTQVEQLTWMISGGFATALTVFVGQNFGAGQDQRIKKGFAIMSAILLPYALMIALLLRFFPEFLMGIFVDDPVTKNYGIAYLRIISICQVFMMMEAIGTGFFNGIGKTYISSIIGIGGNLLRIPFLFWLTKSMAEEGIWWALNLSDITKGLILYFGAIIGFTQLDRFRQRKNVDLAIQIQESI
ncbi:MAG: MATE family efflux transporter [Candidatus Izemoplasmatales bacterium]|mgnify:CR=1 FL=1|jgi:putative MATE family efflux protein|nr:MATE family efflux transporter [Candidatus Izemoplasmatales bacterium]MDY0372822.1 MATE family efflux transporter [Candidatus Izemoplasmatales bacterium]NLF49244.1 MATE family efflux transporter [Acholeplasmataceae bacterium]